MRKKILCITLNQFGYQINMYHYIKYLKENYDFSYICVDYGKEKATLSGVDVYYIDKEGSGYRLIIKSLQAIRKLLKNNTYDLVIIKYFTFSSLVKAFTRDRILLHIDSVAVTESKFQNVLFNLLLRLESLFFQNIVTLSDTLRDYLYLPKGKTDLVPLGSERFSSNNYDYSELNLIYIGTFNWRRIYDTIDGFYQFYEKFSHEIGMSYTIIGYGNTYEVEKIKNRIKDYGLEDIINFQGTVPYDKLSEYVSKSNVGVSYIPITPEYDVQPPTKTIEYLMAGLPTIATATEENKKLMNKKRGVVIDDSSAGFYEGLCEIKNSSYNNDEIRKSMDDFTWERIVNTYLKPIIERILPPIESI